MTTVTGIIAEFNPFHNGHKRLLTAAAGVKVVVMSGNWMQRGEPAFVDKWTRAQMALENGADLVVELPLLAAVQGADFFAAAAVEILARLGVNELLFGTEDTQTDYGRIAQLYAEKSDEMKAYLAELPALMSYPLKAQQMWEHFAAVKFDGNTPNHILGLAYAKAVAGRRIQLRTLRRETSYNSSDLTGNLASATAIRANLSASENFVPENCWTALQAAPKVAWTDFWELLRYRITLSNLTEIYQVNEELSNRIQVAIKTSSNLTELIEQVYTKRYTKGHIRRLLTYILLGIPRDFALPEQIHVLGFTSAGQEILAQARGAVVTRIGRYPWDSLTQRADAIYQLANPEIAEQTYGRKPLML